MFLVHFDKYICKYTYIYYFSLAERSHLSADRTEKQAVLYSTARINEARQRHTAKEQLEATGQDAMWGDADEAFDLQLENFGVDTEQLSAPVPRRIFRAWLEGWEKEALKKPCPVAEARLLEKYKSKLFQAMIFNDDHYENELIITLVLILHLQGLVFYDPDNETTYTVARENLEYRKGRDGGWCVIGEPADDEFEDEPFMIGDMLIDMIAETPQDGSVQVIQREEV